MIDQDLQPLFRKWAAQKLNKPESRIRDVDFGTIHGGHCPTCEYTTFGAFVTYTNGTRTEIEGDATEVIRQLLELAREES